MRAGAVFVWEEEEASIRRWTDHLKWSRAFFHWSNCYIAEILTSLLSQPHESLARSSPTPNCPHETTTRSSSSPSPLSTLKAARCTLSPTTRKRPSQPGSSPSSRKTLSSRTSSPNAPPAPQLDSQPSPRAARPTLRPTAPCSHRTTSQQPSRPPSPRARPSHSDAPSPRPSSRPHLNPPTLPRTPLLAPTSPIPIPRSLPSPPFATSSTPPSLPHHLTSPPRLTHASTHFTPFPAGPPTPTISGLSPHLSLPIPSPSLPPSPRPTPRRSNSLPSISSPLAYPSFHRLRLHYLCRSSRRRYGEGREEPRMSGSWACWGGRSEGTNASLCLYILVSFVRCSICSHLTSERARP